MFLGNQTQKWKTWETHGSCQFCFNGTCSCLGRGTDFKPRLNFQLDNQFWYQTIKSTVVHELEEKIDINPYIAKYNPTSWFWFVVQWFRHQNHTQQNFPRGCSGNQKGTRKIQEIWMVKSCKIWVISVSFPCHFLQFSQQIQWSVAKGVLGDLALRGGENHREIHSAWRFLLGKSSATGRDFPARHGWRHWNVIFQKIIGHRSLTSNPLERFWTSKA